MGGHFTRRGSIALLIIMGMVVAACGTPPATWSPDTTSRHPGESVMDAVERRLDEVAGDQRDSAWWTSDDNELAPGWIMQTPDCWGQTTCSDPAGFDHFLQTMEDDLASATEVVDLLTLKPLPTGEFREAIVRGLRRAMAAGERPLVRILGGSYPFSSSFAQPFSDFSFDAVRQYGQRLVDDVGGLPGQRLPMIAADAYSNALFSWNHAKVVAVDGRSSIVGGHNMWAGVYLQTENPVHDLTMRVTGTAAQDAHVFADRLWTFACDNPQRMRFWKSVAAPGCVPTATPAPQPGTGNARVMTVASYGVDLQGPSPFVGTIQTDNAAACTIFPDLSNLGGLDFDRQNLGQEAIRAMISAAQDNIFVSHQDIIGFCPVPEYDARLIDAMVDRLLHGVDITIVLSTPGGDLAYSNTESFDEVSSLFLERALLVTDHATARHAICSNLQLAPIRFGPADTWPGEAQIGNHAKSISVDDETLSIGSLNMYPSWLQDLLYVVEDPAAIADYNAEYRDPMWQWSRNAAVIDSDQGRCEGPGLD